MFVKQLYTSCLSEAAYFIASDGEAAIVDPLRDVDTYITMAKEQGVQIKYIFETHFHADFVSGHVELAEKTGHSWLSAVTDIVRRVGARQTALIHLNPLAETLQMNMQLSAEQLALGMHIPADGACLEV